MDVDLQPIYVKLTVKGKVFQIVFNEEVQVEKSTALRSQTTGNYRLTLKVLESEKIVHNLSMFFRTFGIKIT